MGTHAISSGRVFPTRNDIQSSGVGDGRFYKEANPAAWLACFADASFVKSGFTVPASSANLDISVAAGEAILNGFHIVTTASVTVTAADASTNYLWLMIGRDANNLVDERNFVVNTSATPPDSDHLLLAVLVAAGGVITSTRDARVTTPAQKALSKIEVFTTSGSGSWTCPTNVFRVKAKMWAGGGGGGGDGGGGGGGGSGAYREEWFSVVPGTVYSYNIGAAGTAAVGNGNGGAGGNTWFSSSGNAASGGGGGTGGAGGGAAGTAGAEPTYSSSVWGKAGRAGVAGAGAAGGTGGASDIAIGGTPNGGAGSRGSGGGGANSGGSAGAGGVGVLVLEY